MRNIVIYYDDSYPEKLSFYGKPRDVIEDMKWCFRTDFILEKIEESMFKISRIAIMSIDSSHNETLLGLAQKIEKKYLTKNQLTVYPGGPRIIEMALNDFEHNINDAFTGFPFQTNKFSMLIFRIRFFMAVRLDKKQLRIRKDYCTTYNLCKLGINDIFKTEFWGEVYSCLQKWGVIEVYPEDMLDLLRELNTQYAIIAENGESYIKEQAVVSFINQEYRKMFGRKTDEEYLFDARNALIGTLERCGLCHRYYDQVIFPDKYGYGSSLYRAITFLTHIIFLYHTYLGHNVTKKALLEGFVSIRKEAFELLIRETYLENKVIGQDRLRKDISLMIYRNYNQNLYSTTDHKEEEIENKLNILSVFQSDYSEYLEVVMRMSPEADRMFYDSLEPLILRLNIKI